MHSDKVVVECNEDGFTEANLRAISNINKTSKVDAAQGYIGEKGIGFKSVFKVAWKVHIQSGPFSFCFKHRRGDSGMGMISPEWQDPTETLRGPLTRMTFTLHDDGEPSARAAQRDSISEQLGDLQPAMLLFLKNIRRIEVHFFDDNGVELRSKTMAMSLETARRRAEITKVGKEQGAVTDTTKEVYHVTKQMVTGLSPNENREYTAEEHARQAYATAEAIMAFPLTEQSVPVVEHRELFAFLPVRQVGFSVRCANRSSRELPC